MNDTKVDFRSAIPVELWMEEILPFLEAKNLNNVQRVSKFFNELVNETESYWTRVAKERGILLPDYICRTCTNLTVIEGTLKTKDKIETRYGFSYLWGRKSNPTIPVIAKNKNKAPLISGVENQIGSRFGFGWPGGDEYEKDKETYLNKEEVKERLKQFSIISESFPNHLPIKFFINIKDNEEILFKFQDRLLKLKLIKNFKENFDYIVRVTNSVHPTDPYTIDKTFTATFIDLDKMKILEQPFY